MYTMDYYSAFKKKEENLARCNKTNGPLGHYANWNKSVKYCMISLKCGILKKKTTHRYKEQSDVTKSVGKMSKGGQKAQIYSLKKSHGDVMYIMVTIVNDTILCNWKLLKVILKSDHKGKNV